MAIEISDHSSSANARNRDQHAWDVDRNAATSRQTSQPLDVGASLREDGGHPNLIHCYLYCKMLFLSTGRVGSFVDLPLAHASNIEGNVDISSGASRWSSVCRENSCNVL